MGNEKNRFKKICVYLIWSTLTSVILSSESFGQRFPSNYVARDVVVELDSSLSGMPLQQASMLQTSMKNFAEQSLNHSLFEPYREKLLHPLIVRIVTTMEGGLFDDGVSEQSIVRDGRPRVYVGVASILNNSWATILAHEVFHFAHYLINPDEPAWVREGLAHLFEFLMGQKPNGSAVLKGLMNIQTPLMGEYRPRVINSAQYGHNFLFFHFMWSRCGGDALVKNLLVPSSIKGREKIEISLKSQASKNSYCQSFDRLALTFEVARAHNRMVFQSPTWEGEVVPSSHFRVWPVSRLVEADTAENVDLLEIDLFEPVLRSFENPIQVKDERFEVYWLEQDNNFSVVKSKLPPPQGRFRQLIIRVR